MALRVLLPWQDLVDQLQLPGIEPILWHIDDDPNDAPPADVLVTERPSNPELRSRVSRIKGLKHVHLLSIGYEWVLEHLPEQVSLTNSKGAVEDATAEHCLALVLASLRQLPQASKQQRERQWTRTWTGSLHGSKVVLLGAGGVSSEIRSRLQPFKPAELTSFARSERIHEQGYPIYSLDRLWAFLPTADVVIVALPHTPETEQLIDAEFLSAMKDGSLLVNVGRGPIVDTEALLPELQAGRLHAALDVTDPEPLPADHPLWSAPNCIITPHMAGDTGQFISLVSELAVDQVIAFAHGEVLANRITN
ncbi:2-hydroxyacid dehydrogenase [Glutamicibacter halophytocola]|uniref:2-hydroxyacid dehydrogenase n=1 Tax=Glutamicibacter halophytocola TaxID=1933880 RepID=A0ABX5YCR3_9MICC|nr:2-hydroxyacid dehydrogenase [Glutamicibacter halophytocola]QDY67477.1 2-hydroxyacid dehydrogenase [Glutamicibacter halophytocola]